MLTPFKVIVGGCSWGFRPFCGVVGPLIHMRLYVAGLSLGCGWAQGDLQTSGQHRPECAGRRLAARRKPP